MAHPHVWNNAYGEITLSDGTEPPVTLTVPYDKGDFSLDGIKSMLNEEVVLESRGRYIATLPGARVYPSLGFSMFMPGVAAEVVSFLTGTGVYSANISTLGATDAFMHVNCALKLRKSLAGGTDETLTMTHCSSGTNLSEANDGNTLASSLNCRGTIDLNGNTLTERPNS